MFQVPWMAAQFGNGVRSGSKPACKAMSHMHAGLVVQSSV